MVREVTIYGLYAPGGPIRYIGKTSRSLSVRLAEHIRHAKNGKEINYRLKWIRKLLRNGEQLEAVVLECVSNGRWEEAERKWITFYKEAGFKLVNGDDGGSGGFPDQPVKRGEDHYRSKLTSDAVAEICEKYATGRLTQEELAEEYSISAGNVGLIVRGKTWKHVARPITRRREEGIGRKLTRKDVIEISERYARGGCPQSQLAEEYGVCHQMIHNIVTGKRWAHTERPITHAADGDIEIVRHRGGPHNPIRGEEIGISKLTAEHVIEIRNLYAAGGASQDALADRYGVAQQTISALIRGETWKHV